MSVPAPTTWLVQRTTSTRFPFRVVIIRNGKTLLAVRAQSSWPGPGQQIFCIREDQLDAGEHLETIESVPVRSYTQLGRKLAIVLDRPTRKRCEFLKVAKAYKDREGSYDQIFFRTESGIRAHRSRSHLELKASGELTIAVDSSERYGWKFPNAVVLRRRLPAGDYALMEDGHTVAIIERKTFDGLLSDVGSIQGLHHQLADVARCERAIVVVEAQYADFLDDRRLSDKWPASYVARALAEVAAMHPTLPVIFAGNRKLANRYALQYFEACSSRGRSPQLSLVSEPDPSYNASPIEDIIRDSALAWDGAFAAKELADRFPAVPPARVRRVLAALEAEGMICRSGKGRGVRWSRRLPLRGQGDGIRSLPP